MLENLIGGAALIVSFLVTVFLTKSWIKITKRINLVGKDMNKVNGKDIAEAGGIGVVLAFSISILFFIFFKTFYMQTETHLVFLLATITTVLLIGLLGFIDDILGWKVGMRQMNKFLLTIPIALPLMVVNAGVSVMSIPFIGPVELGIFYPLLIVPIGIIGAANGFNLVAGFNSLEAGMGVIILSTLGFVAWTTGVLWVSLIAFSAVFALLGFLVYNRYPSKVFPGDTLTYSVGALIAIVAILGNMEKIAVILFIPYFIEFILKLRSKLKAESFGIPDENNTLKPKYEKNYSLNHVVMRYFPSLFGRDLKEYEVVGIIFLFELILVGVALLI
ncbi:MAG: glycosyl transferase family 4 [Candidatus Aenigmarchaeota archaeon]|nr:glycosyl transferase family 4 [Candidatus Aenigmarchaeota archaeon]